MGRKSKKRELIDAASAALEFLPTLLDDFDRACGVDGDSPERRRVTEICDGIVNAIERAERRGEKTEGAGSVRVFKIPMRPHRDAGYYVYYSTNAILRVEGSGGGSGLGGFKVGGWDATTAARVEHGGLLVTGPRAYFVGLAGVIDTRGGTGAEHAQAQAEGRFFVVRYGDTLDLGFGRFVVRIDGQGYPTLTLIDGDA